MKKYNYAAQEVIEFITGNSIMNFRAVHSESKAIVERKHYTFSNVNKLLDSLNKDKYMIFFQINSGGTKVNSITRFNSVFIDLDAGRNPETDEYYDHEFVNRFKESSLKKIYEFNLRPSVIIETRNGLHVYWKLNNENHVVAEDYLNCLSKLRSHFNSDPKVVKTTQILRVPEYLWNKTNEEFMCSTIHFERNEYLIKDILAQLEHINISSITLNNDNSRANIIGKIPKLFTNKELETSLALIQDQNVTELRNFIMSNATKLIKQTLPKTTLSRNVYDVNYLDRIRFVVEAISCNHIFNTYNEFTDFINAFPLELILGIAPHTNFNCILPNHKDDNASASLYFNNDGFTLYNCFSLSCGKTMGTIEVVSSVMGVPSFEASTFLGKTLNVDYRKYECSSNFYDTLQEIKHNLTYEVYDDVLSNLNYDTNIIKRSLMSLFKFFQTNGSDKNFNNDGFLTIEMNANFFELQNVVSTIDESKSIFSNLKNLGIIELTVNTELANSNCIASTESMCSSEQNCYLVTARFITLENFEELIVY